MGSLFRPFLLIYDNFYELMRSQTTEPRNTPIFIYYNELENFVDNTVF